MTIKLEVGRRYVDRQGNIRGPIIQNPHPHCESWPFWAEDARDSYKENGRMWFDAHPRDLIALAPDEAPQPQQPDELATLRERVRELEDQLAHEKSINRGEWACQRDVDRYQTENEALRAENARLREALEPFADIGIGTNPDYRPEIRLCREAIIAARAALAQTEAGK